MTIDRRRHARRARLIRLAFEWAGRAEVAVTTDLSEGGAFLNTTVYPPLGAELSLRFQPPGGLPPLSIRVAVRRVVDPLSRVSVVPGIGVSIREVRMSADPVVLADAVRDLFAADVVVRTDPDGYAVWVPPHQAGDPSPDFARMSRVRADLRDLEDLRPQAADTTDRAERRSAPRVACGTDVTLYASRTPLAGRVRDISLRGMWIETAEQLPRVGDVVTCRYPMPTPQGPGWVRLVGVVVRAQGGRDRGLAVEIVRRDDLGNPGGFEAHLRDLGAREAAAALATGSG